MAIIFDNPVVAGTVLVRQAIQSPDYVPGVSGWSVNIDGSAEFNNLTIRGEFVGTEFVLNSDGAFFYDSAPALNHLVYSIATNVGTDAFGNQYLPGFIAYDVAGHTGPVQFIQINQGTILVGSIDAGVFQASQNCASIGSSGQRAFLNSGLDTTIPANTDQACFSVLGGLPNATTGGASTPYGILWDFSIGNSPVDFYLSGSLIHCDNNGNRSTWQAPAYGTNWAGSTTYNGSSLNQTLRYRFGGEDTLIIEGCFKAGATLPGATLLTLPNTGFRRKTTNTWIECYRNNGGVTSPSPLQLTTGGNINVVTTMGGGIVAGNEYYIPAQVIPLNNIP